jgi:hypothetical protein
MGRHSRIADIDVYLNNEHQARATDLELLGQLKAFSWLSAPDKTRLLSALEITNFTKAARIDQPAAQKARSALTARIFPGNRFLHSYPDEGAFHQPRGSSSISMQLVIYRTD